MTAKLVKKLNTKISIGEILQLNSLVEETIALKPSEMIIFDDGTFKSTTNYSSKMYTKYKRPRYTSKMYLTFHLKKDGTILDTFVMRWYVSCGDGRYVVSGNYDPKYFDLINGGSIEYGGTAYNC